MAIISISEAAQQWQVDQAILYQKIKNGDLIMSTRPDGTRGINDTEMVKIFGVVPRKIKKSMLLNRQVLHGKRPIKISSISDNVISELTPMGLRLTFRWLTLKSAFFACCFALSGILLFFVLLDMSDINLDYFTIRNIIEIIRNTSDKGIEYTKVVLISMMLVPILLSFSLVLGILVNKTIIIVTKKYILVRHGPLPWFGNRRIEISDIDQLYRERYTVYYPTEPRYQAIKYRVGVVLKNSKKIDLVVEIDSYYFASFLEEKIKGWLEIQDKIDSSRDLVEQVFRDGF